MKYILILILTIFLVGCNKSKKGAFLETIESQNDVPTSVKKLKILIEKAKLTYFETIDHQENAKKVGMDLRPNSVVVFGNPKMGTVLMNCNPSIGLDLPLRMQFTTSYEGDTTIIYTNPEYWSLKHNIKDKNCLNIINKAKIALESLAQEVAKK